MLQKMSQMTHQQGMAQSDQQGMQQAMLAEQGQGHAREQAQMGHEQALAQAEQAAKLAPKPASGDK